MKVIPLIEKALQLYAWKMTSIKNGHNLFILKTLFLEHIQTYYKNKDMHRKRNKRAIVTKVEILIEEDLFFFINFKSRIQATKIFVKTMIFSLKYDKI